VENVDYLPVTREDKMETFWLVSCEPSYAIKNLQDKGLTVCLRRGGVPLQSETLSKSTVQQPLSVMPSDPMRTLAEYLYLLFGSGSQIDLRRKSGEWRIWKLHSRLHVLQTTSSTRR
jgi:hypothetical protein